MVGRAHPTSTNIQRGEINVPTNYDESAVYFIRILKRGKRIPICRFLSIDAEGLICIGVTIHMETRRKQFMSSMKKSGNHSEGDLLNILDKNSVLKKKIPEYTIEYRFIPFRNRESAALNEEKEIKSYVKQFGEVPPLNSEIPNRRGKRYW